MVSLSTLRDVQWPLSLTLDVGKKLVDCAPSIAIPLLHQGDV